ncbi:MFS transporter [Patescibacteria group bacterium]
MIGRVGLKILYTIGFIIALSEAFPGYIRSTFVEEFVDVQRVGLFFIGSAVLSLIVINFFPYFINKFTNYRLFLTVLVINILSIILLITTDSTVLAFIAFIIGGATMNLVWISMDIFIEKCSTNITTGRTRTIYLTLLSSGWLISPLIVGFLVGDNNYRLVYIFSIAFLLTVIGLVISKRKQLGERIHYKHHQTLKTLKNIWQNINLRGIFAISFLLEFFFAIIVVYTPIYLHEYIGLSWLTIGIVFTFMLIPFILFEIPAGTFADKYHSEKKILMLGFMILVSSVSLIFFIESTNPVVWAVILFLTRCGAALIQAMRESYFFKIVDVKDLDYINFFRDIRPLAILIGMGLSIVVLKFYSLQYLFFFLAAVLFLGFYFTWRLKRVVPGE